MISFVKELDEETEAYLQMLKEHRASLMKKHRVRIVVLWLDGDQAKFERWAGDNELTKLQLGVVSANDEKLRSWNLDASRDHTMIFLNRKTALATISVDPPTSAESLDQKLGDVFRN